MNKVVLLGRATKSFELKSVKDTIRTNNTLAVQGAKKDETDFINIVAFGNIAENLTKYVEKGQRVLIEGVLKVNNYKDNKGENKTYTYVLVTSFNFIENKTKDTNFNESETDLPFN